MYKGTCMEIFLSALMSPCVYVRQLRKVKKIMRCKHYLKVHRQLGNRYNTENSTEKTRYVKKRKKHKVMRHSCSQTYAATIVFNLSLIGNKPIIIPFRSCKTEGT